MEFTEDLCGGIAISTCSNMGKKRKAASLVVGPSKKLKTAEKRAAVIPKPFRYVRRTRCFCLKFNTNSL